MWTAQRIAAALVAIALGTALPLAAQQPPGAQDAIAQLQAQNVLTDEDTATLRTWIDERVQAIAAGDPVGSAQAVAELRKRYDGTSSFKEAYAAAAVNAVTTAYKRAKRDSAAQLLAILNTLNHVSAAPTLREALSDERVPVRTTAAIGLRNLRDQMARAGGTLVSDSIAALRDAGKRETSPVALKLIYQAMDYTTVTANPDQPGTAAAIFALLEARGQQYGTRDVKAEGADHLGLELAGKLSAQLDDAGRQRLAGATAKMLHYAVTRYTSELHKIQDKDSSRLQVKLRNRIELFIVSTETLLSKLTAPPTKTEFKTITSEMQERPEDEKATYMKIAMNTWADTLQNRMQIDVHMDDTEPPEEEEDEPNP